MFEWEQIPEASGYDLQLSGDSGFSDNTEQIFTNDLVYIERDRIDWESTYF